LLFFEYAFLKDLELWPFVATEDKSIHPELERMVYKRAGSIVTELKGSHTLYMSQANAVAAIIESAATAK